MISLKKLHPDSRNANVVESETFEILSRNIKRTQFCPSLLVRPHPKRKGHYIIVDGHHRKLIVEALGWKEIDCQVKEMTDDEAGVLLLTLNRLRGTDIPRKRAELMVSLLDSFPVEELSLMLPETKEEIDGLLALIRQDDDTLEKALKAQIEAEEKTLPIPFGFMIPAEDAPIVRKALSLYQVNHQAQALVAICRDILVLKEVEQ